MPARKCYRLTLLSFLICLLAPLSYASEPPPNLDFIGGYFEGEIYRCYAEPCFTIHRESYPEANNIVFNEYDWPHWLDLDDNCQNEHVQMLFNTSLTDTKHLGGDPCDTVIAGHWEDPYSGTTYYDAKELDVDHIISLREAHQYGASGWQRNKRALFANAPNNLIVVSAKLKAERQQRSASEWMPPNENYWCDYVVRREMVARQFKLYLPLKEQEFNKQIKTLYCKY